MVNNNLVYKISNIFFYILFLTKIKQNYKIKFALCGILNIILLKNYIKQLLLNFKKLQNM